jgi:hypothetical protein
MPSLPCSSAGRTVDSITSIRGRRPRRSISAFTCRTIGRTRKLTLNLGLRYDFDLPRTERYNRYSWFDFTAPSPLAGKVPEFPALKGQFRFTDGNTRSPIDTDLNNVQPRFGFA